MKSEKLLVIKKKTKKQRFYSYNLRFFLFLTLYFFLNNIKSRKQPTYRKKNMFSFKANL